MCGILGIIAKDNGKKLMDASVEAIKKRGPDGTGRYIDGGVGFYHTRLAVIDKKVTSNQPIMSPCSNFVLICNGEIYNYKELKRQYDYDYQTTSDCEVILACYRTDGIKGFKRLKGMFSFGVYDKARRKVIIYRDAVGKKPLFYCKGKDVFLFSSTVTAIKDNLPFSVTVNKEALTSYLTKGYVRPDISFYEEIVPLLPGFALEIDVDTGSTSNRYITPETISYDGFSYNHETIMRETERLLTQSIERRVDGIENLVLLFSGGVDSTVLAKMISSIAGKRLNCIALRPLIPLTCDDLYGRYAARKLDLNYVTVSIQPRSLKEDIDRAISLLDQPLSLYSYYFLTYLTCRAKEFGNVLFTGDGGDEVFYGYSSKIDAWFSNGGIRVSDDCNYNVGPKVSSELSSWGRRQATVDLLGHGFVKVDKATAEQQMEARCPFLDWDLMYFVRRIPAKYFIESRTSKNILKELLNEFPNWFVNRKKVGFAFNFRYLMIPWYKSFYREINFERLIELGACTSAMKFSYKGIFGDFDKFWKLYVLSKFMLLEEKAGSKRALCVS